MPKAPLTEKDWQAAASELGCEVAAIKAVARVESPKGAFVEDGDPPALVPPVLFERHKFSKHTGGRFDESHPDISNPKWGGYGPASKQHERLARAAALDRDAALMSASWGRFQILGENFKQAGHQTLQGFINAMYRDEASQLRAFVTFIKNDSRLLAAIRSKAWKTFARWYNGPAYAEHGYDERMADAYAEERAA